MQRFPILILAIVVCISTPALAGLDKDVVKVTLNDFNTTHRAVRAEFFDFPAYTLKVSDEGYACHIPQALRRLALAGETFRVRKLITKRDHFRVEFETPGKTRLTVRVQDRGKIRQEFLDEGFKQLLNDIFEFGPPPPPPQFVGHTESRLLHIDRCNHLPIVELQKIFAAHDEGGAAGYRDCPICFESTEVLPYPNYMMHRALGLQAARSFELVHPLSKDESLQARLDELGATVLAHWPFELSGFDYDFRVVESDQPLAVSFRTGIVLVSDTLLEAADAEEELLFILAHEITHCEIHLPPRSPHSQQRYFDLVSAKYSAFNVWASNLQLAADLVAVAWFQGAPEGRWELSRAKVALSKIQHAAGGTDQFVPEAGQSLGLQERLWLFESGRFLPGDPRHVIAGIDGEGDIRYELRFLGVLKDVSKRETIPYFLLTTTDYEEKMITVSRHGFGGALKDANGKKAEFYVRPYLSKPGFTTLVIGRTRFDDYFEKFTPGPLREAKVYGVSGVKDWRVLEAEEGS